jgi:hypothetical protein
MDWGRLGSVSLCFLVMLGLSAYIVRTHRRYDPAFQALERISSAVMQRLIYGRPHNFRIDSDSLIALKRMVCRTT